MSEVVGSLVVWALRVRLAADYFSRAVKRRFAPRSLMLCKPLDKPLSGVDGLALARKARVSFCRCVVCGLAIPFGNNP